MLHFTKSGIIHNSIKLLAIVLIGLTLQCLLKLQIHTAVHGSLGFGILNHFDIGFRAEDCFLHLKCGVFPHTAKNLLYGKILIFT